MIDPTAAAVDRLIRRSLRRAFRRVCWVGPWPELAPDRPVVLYANHHGFYDGYLARLVAQQLGRPTLTWMAEWDRFPFFAAVGAQPFPPDDARRRAATVRRTARRMQADPSLVTVLFPEGRLHPPEDGLDAVPAAHFRRLAALLPPCQWWPVAMHVTWWGEAHPTALLAGGPVRTDLDGREMERLADVWERLKTPDPTPRTTLLDGRPGPDERWHLGPLRGWFERYL